MANQLCSQWQCTQGAGPVIFQRPLFRSGRWQAPAAGIGGFDDEKSTALAVALYLVHNGNTRFTVVGGFGAAQWPLGTLVDANELWLQGGSS